MNSDTFKGLATGSLNGQLNSLTALGTTETVLTMVAGTGNINAYVQIPQVTDIIGSNTPLDPNANPAISVGNLGRPGSDYRGARPYFNAASFDGRPFVIQATGRVTTSAVDSTTGHAINIYQATAANGAQLTTKSTVFQALTSATLAAGSYNYFLQCNMIWDSVSQLLTGWAEGYFAGTYTSRTAITAITVTSPKDLYFFSSVKFNTGAANVITPVEFNLSMV